MKHHLILPTTLLLLIAPLSVSALCGTVRIGPARIGYVEALERSRNRMRLGEMIAETGLAAENVTHDLEKGIFRPGRFDVLLIGSYAMRNGAAIRLFEEKSEEMRDFVSQGGCVVMFSQDSRWRSKEEWLPPGMFLLRGEKRYDSLGYVERKHPLFSHPNSLFTRRINEYWQEGDLSQETFRLVMKGRVLAAQDDTGRGPWCVEFGWGRGRVLFFAFKPERRFGGREDTKKMAREILENTLTYATAVAKGRAPQLPDFDKVLEKNSFLEEEVNAAVDRGVAYLKLAREKDGSWGAFGRHKYGPTALAVTAILGSGVSKHKPWIQEAVKYLLRGPADRYEYEGYTYDTGLILMALDAYGAPMYERFQLEKLPPDQRESFEFHRTFSDREKALVHFCWNWLYQTRCDSGCWTYYMPVHGGGGDISNTQFAVLGLRAASRCGYETSSEVWIKLIETLLDCQAETGPKVELPEYKSFNRTTGKPKFTIRSVRARPWGYPINLGVRGGNSVNPEIREPTGSRTAIGVASLIIAFEELALQSKSKASRYARKVERAVRDGLGWLHANWSVKENPGSKSEYHYYYLYALERVGVLYNKRFIGDHEWYQEGAAWLLGAQLPDGSWSRDIVTTCFALMFLKRSTPPPVITLGK